MFFSPKQNRKRKRGNESTNVVIRQEVDTSFDESAQEERQVGPHFHHEGVEVCAVTWRECSDHPEAVTSVLCEERKLCARRYGLRV